MKNLWLRRLFFNYNTNIIRILWFVIFGFLFLNTGLIILTGGIPSAFAHTMYIPVLLTAVFLGALPAALVGLVSGLLIGPFMLFDVFDVSTEPILNSLYRTVYFMSIGAMVGWLFKYLRLQFSKLDRLHTHDMDTDIPNYHYYFKYYESEKKQKNKVALTIQINNYESLLLLVGKEGYDAVLNRIYINLKDLLARDAIIILADNRRFWVEMSYETYQQTDDKLQEHLEKRTVYHENVPLYINYVIGVSMPDFDKRAKTRFKESDIAATYATTHNMRFVVYHQKHQEEQALFKRLGELPKAIEEDDLFLMYQPIIDLKTNDFVGFEALIRWHYKGRILNPVDFIPLAEQTRIIDSITQWVTDRMISDYKHFRLLNDKIKLTMNISQRNLYEKPLIENMIYSIDHAKVPNDAFELEVTESTMMLNRTAAQSFLARFKKYGIHAVLDDFGTEYSSLAYLKELPIKKVKIDRSFTMNILNDEDMKTLIKLIIDLAHYMDLEVIAEGVEDDKILATLKSLKCDFAQGFYYAKPMVLKDALAWIKEQKKIKMGD